MTTGAVDKQALYEQLRPLLRDPKGPDHEGRIMAFCPVPLHNDGAKHGQRSLSLHPTIGVTCFAGCSYKAIMDAFQVRSPRPDREPAPQKPQEGEKLVKVYDYVTPEGKVVGNKGRYESPNGKKRFAWKPPEATSFGGKSGLRMEDMPLYRAQDLVRGDPTKKVYFVEGEKAADACASHGLLAVTSAGGASQRDFGSSLEVLRGRTVILWPDNDVVGREYMSRIEARLRGVASSTHYVMSPFPLPEKGDAWDYFALGGSVATLEEGVITETTSEYLSEDTLRVTTPTAMGPFDFTFASIEQSARAFETELTVNLRGGKNQDKYTQRINILSSSQRTELRRDLDTMFGKDLNWTKILNTVLNTARTAWVSMQRAEDVYDIPLDASDIFLVEPLLPAEAPIILFGDGESLKTWFTLSLGLHISLGNDFLGMATPGVPVLFVDYEDTRTTFRRRLTRLAKGMGLDDVPSWSFYYWRGTMPLLQESEAIRAFIKEKGIGLVIIDSVAPACGMEPERSEAPIQYFRALKKLGNVTTLSIAHITKGSDTKKPFGSTFWHNEARRTWYVEKADEEFRQDIDLALYPRKVNDGPKPRDIAVKVSFQDPWGPITVSTTSFQDAPQLQEKRALSARILDAVKRSGAMTCDEIAQALDMKDANAPETIRVTVKRQPNTFGYGPLPNMSGNHVWSLTHTTRPG